MFLGFKKYYYNYFQILDKSIIKRNKFHFFLSNIDTAIILFKILNIYHSNYNNNLNNIHKYLIPSFFFRDYSILMRILPIIIYLIFIYLILIIYLPYDINNKKINRLDMIIINIFELFFIRISFIFYCEFIFCLFIFYIIFFIKYSFPIFYFYKYIIFSFR